MHNIDKLRKELKRLATGNLGVVLQKLDKVLNDDNHDSFNVFLMISMDFNRWKSDTNTGIQSYESLNQRYAALTNRLLSFIDAITEESIKVNYHLEEEIHEHILVVCKTQERLAYMEKFFPKEVYINLKYSKPHEKTTADKFDIVLFDNSPQDDDEGTHELLKFYLDNAKPVVLYFGGFLPLLNSYPEKAYATNSVFSIHARIKEVIEFLKYRSSIIA